jgi:serine/threonine protein phosphatase PrpC
VTLVTQYAALSDIGLHRQTNEDSYVAAPPLFVVCDGMGGAEAGEVASSLAVETLAERFAAGDTLMAAAQAANDAVFARASSRADESGMGTTLTAAVVQGELARFVHIGDSRAYLLRDGRLEQLSEDHSLVGEMVREGTLTKEEAAAHPQRSILSRVLGTEAGAQLDEFAAELRRDDVLLLCSDGLSGEVSDDELRQLLAVGELDVAARGLIDAARAAGGHDNITAVVIRVVAGNETAPGAEGDTQVLTSAEVASQAAGAVQGADATQVATGAGGPDGAMDDPLVESVGPTESPPAGERSARRRLALLVAVLALVALLGVAGVVVVNTCYFVGVEDGQLAVYSGLPWALGPLELNSVYLRTTRSYGLLDPAQRARVDARRVHTKEGALRLAEDLGMLP